MFRPCPAPCVFLLCAATIACGGNSDTDGMPTPEVCRGLDSWDRVRDFRDLAAVAGRGDTTVAVGDAGLVRTSKSGNPFQALDVDTARNLTAVAAWESGFLVGGDRIVLESSDGANWGIVTDSFPGTIRGLAFGAGVWVAAQNDGTGALYASADAATWEPLDADAAATPGVAAVAFGAGTFVAVGADGAAWRTTGSSPPATADTGVSDDLHGIAFGAGAFVAVGAAGRVLRSTDGVNWTTQTLDGAPSLQSIAFTAESFFAVGEDGVTYASTDGTDFVLTVADAGFDLRGVAGAGAGVVAVGTGSAIFGSSDGAAWSALLPGRTGLLRGVAVAPDGALLAVGDDGLALLGDDEDSNEWSPTDTGTDRDLFSVTPWNNGWVAVGRAGVVVSGPTAGPLSLADEVTGGPRLRHVTAGASLVAVGDGGEVLSSPNGSTWSMLGMASEPLTSVAVSSTSLIAVGENGVLFTGPLSGPFDTTTTRDGRDLLSVATDGTRWVAVGALSTILVSTDGRVFTAARYVPPAGALFTFNAVVHAGARWVAVGADGLIVASTDGTTWETCRKTSAADALNAVAYDAENDVVWAAGRNETLLRAD